MKWLLAFALGFALAGSFQVIRKAIGGEAIVQMLERREGMLPGSTKVIPDCSCTMQYIGTRVNGRDYFVHLRKLD
jgi:hypothetical protein